MQLIRSSIETQKGPADWFTGDVWLDAVAAPAAASAITALNVRFAPGARTAWHTHPLGQTVFVSAGNGWAQVWGGQVEEINVGDIVWFAPGENHWHGATAATGMTHFASAEALDGKAVDWLEHVTDAQYRPR